MRRYYPFPSPEGEGFCIPEGDIKLIRALGLIGGVTVLCGDRVVTPGTYRLLKEIFKNDPSVVLFGQSKKGPDLPSAYTEIVRQTGQKPRKVFMDALARTTAEMILAAAHLTGTHGPTFITTEKMIGNEKREKQVAEYYNAYGATGLLALGKRWTASLAPVPAKPAPDLQTALRGWMKANGFTPLST